MVLNGVREANILPHVIWWKWETRNCCTSVILWNLFPTRVGMHLLEGIISRELGIFINLKNK